MSPPLSETLVEILEDYAVPIPTTSMRVIASARRGVPVAAEALSRLAASQREEFLRSRRPPRLCHTIDARGRALKPRVWARGEWRLGRRIATPDVLPGWRAGLAVGLCEDTLRLGASPPLGRLALEAVARVLGPVATYFPGSAEERVELRTRLAAHLPAMGLTSLTTEQFQAEERLLHHDPALPAVGLYFGLSDERSLTTEGGPALIRLPNADEEGEPFDVVLRRRLGGDPGAYRDVVAYLQGYSHIIDEWGRAPSTEEFADYWRFDYASVRRDEEVFARAFPEEASAVPIVRLLDQGLPRSGALGWLLAVRVVDAASRLRQPVIPAAGQRWRKTDGSATMTLIEADREQIVGGLHDRESGATSLWVGTRAELADWELSLPDSVWRVRFDVDVIPATLLAPLGEAGIVVDRLARPGDPRPDRAVLSVGTIEGHVVAIDAEEARRKVLNALEPAIRLSPENITVEALQTQSAGPGGSG